MDLLQTFLFWILFFLKICKLTFQLSVFLIQFSDPCFEKFILTFHVSVSFLQWNIISRSFHNSLCSYIILHLFNPGITLLQHPFHTVQRFHEINLIYFWQLLEYRFCCIQRYHTCIDNFSQLKNHFNEHFVIYQCFCKWIIIIFFHINFLLINSNRNQHPPAWRYRW